MEPVDNPARTRTGPYAGQENKPYSAPGRLERLVSKEILKYSEERLALLAERGHLATDARHRPAPRAYPLGNHFAAPALQRLPTTLRPVALGWYTAARQAVDVCPTPQQRGHCALRRVLILVALLGLLVPAMAPVVAVSAAHLWTHPVACNRYPWPC